MKKVKDLFINKILKKKRFLIPLIIIVVVLVVVLLKPDGNIKNIVTDIAKYTDLKETVLATGQVVSSTDLDLSFNTSGVVKSIKVKIGDKVKEGQILANLDQSSELAALTTARGALAAANARYKRTLEGASNEEIALSEIVLDQTKITQEVLVNNAYQNLLNSTPEAYPEDGSRRDEDAPIISGTYSLGKEGSIYLSVYSSSGGLSFTAKGLVEDVGDVNTLIPQPIGNSGLYVKFAEDTFASRDGWVIEIPNKKASDYLINLNAYQVALSQAKSAVDQRTAELAIKKSEARESDLELARADILSAQGQVEQATSRYNNTLITAPLDGTITSIDIKQGELATAMREVIVLQDVSNVYLEANINEANISNIEVGMPIDITFDAFGSDTIFNGRVSKVDPSSTLVSGVVNYKITASIDGQVENLKPGMTANMTIKAKEKSNVLTIPSRAVLEDEKGNKTIRLITDARKKKFKEVKVVTGQEGDGGIIEIVDGLKDGDEFVVLIKTD